MEQAIRNFPEGMIPLVVVHNTGSKHSNDLVIMRLSDWLDWFGEPCLGFDGKINPLASLMISIKNRKR